MNNNLVLERKDSQIERMVKFVCPICKATKELKVSTSAFIESESLAKISIEKKEICEHHFLAFINRSFKVLGYQKVDFELDTDLELPEVEF